MKYPSLSLCVLLQACAALSGQGPPTQDSNAGAAIVDEDYVRALALTSDGQRIAAGYARGRVEWLDAATGEHLFDLDPALPGEVWALEASPDGGRLAGLGHDGQLLLWSLDEPGAQRPTLVAGPLEALPVNDEWQTSWNFGCKLSWSPDGARLALCDWFGNHSLWTRAGERVARWTVHDPDGDPQLAWTSDSRSLFTVDASTIRVRSARTGELVENGPWAQGIECSDVIVSMALHPREELLATGHTDSWLRIWNLESGALEAEIRFPETFSPFGSVDVAAVAFSPSGNQLALSTRTGTFVLIIDTASRERIWSSEYLGAHFFEVMQLSWSPDGSRLWWAFECGGGPLACVEPRKGSKPLEVADSWVPRFAGKLGVIASWPGPGVIRLDGERVW